MISRLIRSAFLLCALLLLLSTLFISSPTLTTAQSTVEVVVYENDVEPAENFLQNPDHILLQDMLYVEHQANEVVYQRVIAELVKTFYIA